MVLKVMTEMPPQNSRMVILAMYSWPEFWSMGEGCGTPSFMASVTSFPKHGHEMHVLVPGPRGVPREEKYRGAVLHRFRTGVAFVPAFRGGRILHHIRLLTTYVYWFVRAVPAGLALAARVSPDVIFGMEKLGAPAASLVAFLSGIPNVTRLFGSELNMVVGHRLKFMLRYRDICAFRAPADFIIMCDDGSAGDEMAAMLGVDMERFAFLPNGLDKAGFMAVEPVGPSATDLGVPKGNRVVLSVGRLDQEKHVDRLLRAAPEILSLRGDVAFLIVGTGEERPALGELADQLGIADHVIFAGAIPHEDLPGVYGSADLQVMLSNRSNATNTLYEAMMSGVPVIALNTGTTARAIEDGRTGILLEVDDLSGLPRIILELLANDEKREALAEAGRRAADERIPTMEERQAIEVEIVERVVNEHRARRGGRRRR